jgi:hypothetical protein
MSANHGANKIIFKQNPLAGAGDPMGSQIDLAAKNAFKSAINRQYRAPEKD